MDCCPHGCEDRSMSPVIDIHELASIADGYLAEITSVAICARMADKNLDPRDRASITAGALSAVETLAIAAQQAIEGLCEGTK